MGDHNIHAQPTMPHLMIDALTRYHDQPCLVQGETVVTYRGLRELASQMIQVLHSIGLGVGSCVAVISANRPEVLANTVATNIAGCITTSLHPLGSVDDHEVVLRAAETECLVYDPSKFESVATTLKERLPSLKLLAFDDSDVADNYMTLADSFEASPLVAPEVKLEDVSAIGFTGGTTGKPKGVMATYRQTAYMTQIQLAEWELPAQSRMLFTTPLSHAAGAFFVPVLQRGGAFYVMDSFNPDAFFDMVEKHNITMTMLVPVMLYTLLDSPRASTADMSSMETIFYGASPISPSRLQKGVEKWGQVFYQFYGQAECPMVITAMRRNEHDVSKPERLSSCGRPTPWVHVSLRDSDGKQVGPDEAGEICVRGPLVMKGYKDMPEKTAEAFTGDWLHTGDIGRFDDEGFLYIVDRTKDMIVSGGFNVFPREVEDIISTHEAVAQVVVIGVPDEQWGEAVKAIVVAKSGVANNDSLVNELKMLVKDTKGAVQSPKSIDFVDAIPLTPVGKPDKKALREKYWQNADRGVA